MTRDGGKNRKKGNKQIVPAETEPELPNINPSVPANATVVSSPPSPMETEPDGDEENRTAAVPDPPPPPPPPSTTATTTTIGPKVKLTGTFPSAVPAHKPTCTVSPFDDGQGVRCPPGQTGLINLGNTCFMNSTLQVLLNIPEFYQYFIEKYYLLDVNSNNPLGMDGELAVAMGRFFSDMWSAYSTIHAPRQIKSLMGQKAAQFAGFAQHDAQEFLSFLLDGLHEDLNRVHNKPYTPAIESNGRPDAQVSKEAWDTYLKRNNSLIVDILHGQLKSRLQCPKCDRVSITFDPYVYLPVPFPKKTKTVKLYFWPASVSSPPQKHIIDMVDDSTIGDMLNKLSKRVGVKSNLMWVYEVFQHKIYKFYQPTSMVSEIMPTDVIHVWEILDEETAGDHVWNCIVIQRLTSAPKIIQPKCHQCSKEFPENNKLKACTNCYREFYCSTECQKSRWEKSHSQKCQFSENVDLVGTPFVLSLPKSKATFSRIKQMAESRCAYSVDVFMPPVTHDKHLALSPTTSSPPPFPSNDCNDETDESENQLPSTSLTNGDSKPANDNSGPSAKKAKVRVVFGERQANGGQQQPTGGYRLFHFRPLRNKEGSTDYSFNRRASPINPPKDKRDDLLEDLDRIQFLGMDWLNKLGTEDFLYIYTKKEVEFKEECSDSGQSKADSELALTDLIHLFTQKETLSKEEAWYCSKCKDHVEASKELSLWKLPPVMIFQLKRFIYSGNHVWRNKDDRKVVYPNKGLDMSKYLSDESEQEEVLYDLFGVVCHSGNSFFGHYISYGQLIDGEEIKHGWRRFDDSRVTPLSSSDAEVAQKDSAYLLFYRRRGCESSAALQSYLSRRSEIPKMEEKYKDLLEREKTDEDGRSETETDADTANNFDQLPMSTDP